MLFLNKTKKFTEFKKRALDLKNGLSPIINQIIKKKVNQ